MRFGWPRLVELALALWLFLSASTLGHEGRAELESVDRVAGVATIVLVLLSLVPRLRLVRIGTVVVASALLAWAWLSFPRPGPAGAQNQLVVGLLLALLVFMPTEWRRPPPSWRPYVEERR